MRRRERPSKAPLSREAIAETGLRRLAEDGPAGLTLRKVASALDTGPASLYGHVDDADELRALVLDLALGAVELSDEIAWRVALKAILRSYRDTLDATPGLGQLAMAVIPAGPNALRLYEVLLERLIQGGIEGSKAAWGVDLLTLHVAAVAAEGDLRRTRKEFLAPVVRSLAEADADAFPNVGALRAELTSGDGESRFDWALDILIDGLVSAPMPGKAT